MGLFAFSVGLQGLERIFRFDLFGRYLFGRYKIKSKRNEVNKNFYIFFKF